jgi:hypothetical protein
MRRARIIRQQRAPVFIGCEGQSEIGYCGWLRNLVRDRRLPFHLELADLGRGAGDPFARVDMAIERIARLEGNREPFIGRYLFLDTDQLAADPDRAERARGRASSHGLTIIWQEPTHEAFLLRHSPGLDTRRPPDKRSADTALAKAWAGYRKPCDAQEIERRLGLDDARRVAGQLPELADLLRMIGLREG